MIELSKSVSMEDVQSAMKKQQFDENESKVMMYLIYLMMAHSQYDSDTDANFVFFSPQKLAKMSKLSLHSIKVNFQKLVDDGYVKVQKRQHAKDQVFLPKCNIK